MNNAKAEKEVWLYFFSQDNSAPKNVVVSSLSNAGVNTRRLSPDVPSGSGILFVDEITPRVCSFLREVSCQGVERVLVIASPGCALTNGYIWHLLQAGASDVFAWDHSANPAKEIAARFERWRSIDHLVVSPLIRNNLIGQSSAWTSVLRQVVEVSAFTDASVLIMGESGTGKELIARLIHSLHPRRRKRELVILDCTTIVPELSGSEFFGHERGSFTGAITTRDGVFALANGGTLFLDEVGELPLVLQAELLRVVQEHAYKRIGSNTWQQTDFRLVCATNKDLLQEEAQGQFRRDFYYRIASWTCKLPPLRERTEDIIPLVCHFLRQLRSEEEPLEIDEPVREYFVKREYPGNVRDLKQLVSRIAHRHVGPGPITVGDIPEEERPLIGSAPGDWCDKTFEQAIRRALLQGAGLKGIGRAAESTAELIALGDENGNLQRAAHKLGITDRALQMRRAARRQQG